MDRELKIVSSIFLTFLIFGIMSLFQQGGFVTPFFLKHLVLLIVSVIFYALNTKVAYSWVLLLFVPVQLVFCLIDPFTVGFLIQKFELSWLQTIHDAIWLKWIFILAYFGFLLAMIFAKYLQTKNKIPFIVEIGLFIPSLILLGFPILYVLNDILTIALILVFYFSAQRIEDEKSKFLGIIGSQYLLLALLQLIEYLH
ncbi:hypothetical protein K6119_03485 [Paracrocinitomix mangrovi]|uniref:hypothetical protein n=1 Tax=Paracrocinitomix mangrovi TaxID=2862509 RepID=UPI001C8ED7E0|nr:hypothetical protein [Paracrocinitomix mangrovi]UKN02573.1 hypothetical protein K6119_03485 [Paracrocinitomix mangrovi]